MPATRPSYSISPPLASLHPTGLVLREGVVTEVSVGGSALAQQMPADWAAELQLTQEQIGNAVQLGLAFHVGSSIAAYLRSHLIARSSEHKAVDEAATQPLLRSPAKHGPSLSLREIRLRGCNRLAVRRLEWNRGFIRGDQSPHMQHATNSRDTREQVGWYPPSNQVSPQKSQQMDGAV
jgi:hypothetical protein